MKASPLYVQDTEGQRIGILVHGHPRSPGFGRALRAATEAMEQHRSVYFYCLDEAVLGLDHPTLQGLQDQGLKLLACAYAVDRREQPMDESVTYGGLGLLSDLLEHTDAVFHFN